MSELDLELAAIPDVAEPLLAFRVWRWDERTLTLLSLNAAVPNNAPRARRLLATPEGGWPPGEPLEATCGSRGVKDHGAVPSATCSCGIYATRDMEVVASYIRGAPILGLVAGSGRVIPGKPTATTLGGLRAQRARIACLFDIASELTIPRRRLRQLAARYQVPLVRPHSDTAEDYRELVRSGWRQ